MTYEKEMCGVVQLSTWGTGIYFGPKYNRGYREKGGEDNGEKRAEKQRDTQKKKWAKNKQKMGRKRK